MFKYNKCLILSILLLSCYIPIIISLDFDKVVIWGHKLHSHTHSYVHYGYYKAFKHLGYPTYWFDDKDNVSTFDFSKCFFITEGQVDKKIPLNETSFYVLYNCESPKYRNLIEKRHAIILQVYTHDCKQRSLEEIDKCILCNINEKIIYMPWATDLLPHEIDEQKKHVTLSKPSHYIAFMGTVSDGQFGNIDKVLQFKKASDKGHIKFYVSGIFSKDRCSRFGIEFNNSIGKSDTAHIEFVRNSYMAPALQGSWQCKHGYIPCRIFKNISYGALGITNSRTVWELFDKKIVFNEDPYQLFYDAEKKLKNITIQEIYELMDLVKEKHTYLNRIDTLLSFFDRVINNK